MGKMVKFFFVRVMRESGGNAQPEILTEDLNTFLEEAAAAAAATMMDGLGGRGVRRGWGRIKQNTLEMKMKRERRHMKGRGEGVGVGFKIDIPPSLHPPTHTTLHTHTYTP